MCHVYGVCGTCTGYVARFTYRVLWEDLRERVQLEGTSVDVRKILRWIFMNLTFIWPNVVIYLYSKINYMHQCIKCILFCNVA